MHMIGSCSEQVPGTGTVILPWQPFVLTKIFCWRKSWKSLFVPHCFIQDYLLHRSVSEGKRRRVHTHRQLWPLGLQGEGAYSQTTLTSGSTRWELILTDNSDLWVYKVRVHTHRQLWPLGLQGERSYSQTTLTSGSTRWELILTDNSDLWVYKVRAHTHRQLWPLGLQGES